MDARALGRRVKDSKWYLLILAILGWVSTWVRPNGFVSPTYGTIMWVMLAQTLYWIWEENVPKKPTQKERLQSAEIQLQEKDAQIGRLHKMNAALFSALVKEKMGEGHEEPIDVSLLASN